MTRNFPDKVTLIFITMIAALSLDSAASGFQIPGTSIAGLATTDALVANPNEAGALVYNPAAMSFHDDASFTFGLILVEPKTSVTPGTGSSKVNDDPDSPFKVPNLYLMVPVTTDWHLGLNISAPFGLETNWRAGSLPAFAGPFAPLEPTKTRLEMLNINPNIAYKLSENLSIAVGFDFYRVREAVFDTQGIGISSDGSGTGWNMAAMYTDSSWSLGLSYRSAVNVDLDGSFDATSVLGFAVNSESQLNFPGILQLGVRFQVTQLIALEFDIERTNWSSFKSIIVRSTGTVPAAGVVPGTELVRSVNNWQDTHSYHLGVMYDLNSDLQLRFGYTYNEDPQPEAHFSNRYPNSKRHMIGTGAKYSMSSWDLEAGLLYARWKDRTVNNSTPYTGADANGTAALNGKYELSGIIVGASVNKYF